jgi:hypothetical protein
MFFTVILIYILIVLVNLCIKNFKEIQQMENTRLVKEENRKTDHILRSRKIITFQNTPIIRTLDGKDYSELKNTERTYRKQYEFDEEPGRDFIRDDHGNIIYGFGYIGAPLLPWSNIGLTPVSFIKFYLSQNIEQRQSFINNYYYSSNEAKYILNLLKTFESTDLNKNEEVLLQDLNNFTKECAPLAYHPQLKFLKEIKDDMINYFQQQLWKERFNNVLHSITTDKINLVKRCYYCNDNIAEFKTKCCKSKKKYICKICLQENYTGLRYDPRHQVYCPFCKNKPYIQLIR